jgi:hypothetical protein
MIIVPEREESQSRSELGKKINFHGELSINSLASSLYDESSRDKKCLVTMLTFSD